MRSNSGKDESRNNLHDPTLRDRDREKSETAIKERDLKVPADHREGRKD
ncbi:hypothetical protein [Sphingomonas sp. URHD0057]|nr:hypothetical protein [Sphingomonas sp. URHD0057]